jgi:membrane-bound serine protease (ClpP class)
MEGKMAYLLNPNLAYFLVVVGLTLLELSMINPKSTSLKVGMTFCLIAAGLELLYLRVNPWAFLVVALSPLPFVVAVRQERPKNPLYLISIFMLPIGSYFLFVDQDFRPLINGPAAFVSILCVAIIWISTERLRNVKGARLSNDPDSVVGLLGEVQTDIEKYSAGSVIIEGELWQARSKEPISAGSTVRVLRQDGFWLTVKKVEKLTKK